jgi:hypothetical protein
MNCKLTGNEGGGDYPVANPAQVVAWLNVSRPSPDPAYMGYQNIDRLAGDGMEALRSIFPDAEANYLNVVLFSTGGVHGHYGTIEAAEQELSNPEEQDCQASVTFCVVKLRTLCMQYGNVEPRNADDINFLKKLRASSHRALAAIGY